MPYELTWKIFVVDHDQYARYRQAIAPLLEAYGGRFRFDFEVARTLRSETSLDTNRLFVLRFPDRTSKERFFADSQYLQIRRSFFEGAVRHIEIIAEYVI